MWYNQQPNSCAENVQAVMGYDDTMRPTHTS